MGLQKQCGAFNFSFSPNYSSKPASAPGGQNKFFKATITIRGYYFMRTTKITSAAVNILFIIMVALFSIEELTNFDIKSQLLKYFVYKGLLIATPLVLMWNLFFLKPIRKKIIGLILPVSISVAVITWGPLKLLLAAGAWQTQTILYQNGHLSFKKVELQMQDVGALGYNQRTVEVLYLTPLFMITNPVSKDIDKHAEWIKINKDVNEMNLTSP
ncbi:hypothetical protein [Foetidibacter luteolus]|uniref:hypothetical protein n=1 Tax=Foetidibacter luteolus TaxID=2608880 RepID=UPI00129B0CCA|nr:hypothetical protein [Foetidibacter luteolus]